jgi:hypothetical protein
MADLDQWTREMDQITNAIPEAFRDFHVSLAVVAFEHIVEGSPVRTGAYRAEHVIGEGESLDLLYESDNRPGPDAVVHTLGTPLAPPSVGDAKVQIADIEPFSLLTILNQRFYASQLETGSSAQAPNGVYGPAADRIASIAERADFSLPGSR